jgi:uncharacterized membrane protein
MWKVNNDFILYVFSVILTNINLTSVIMCLPLTLLYVHILKSLSFCGSETVFPTYFSCETFFPPESVFYKLCSIF